MCVCVCVKEREERQTDRYKKESYTDRQTQPVARENVCERERYRDR